MRQTDSGHGRLKNADRHAESAKPVQIQPLHPRESRVNATGRRGAATASRSFFAPRVSAEKPKPATVARIARKGLCTGCGTCAGVCPREALSMVVDRKKGRYMPRIDRRKCIRCGMCVDVCSGPGMDLGSLSATLFGDIPEDPTLGKHLGVYIGHALDRKVRHDSASGGIVTALLVCALEKGLIDGALVTRMRADEPLEAEAFIARTKEDIIAAAGSKYCPVAANVAVETLLAEEGQFAVVGLPCHIQGIRRAEQRIEALKQRIRYRISLTCNLNYSFHGTEHILKGLGIAPSSVRTLEYRGRGWPGSMLIRTDDGTDTIVPLTDYYAQLEPYSLGRCTLCSDLFGELSDLSCGDAWTQEVVRHDKSGSSFVIARTAEAEELLEVAASQEAVRLSELAPRELLGSQRSVVFKRRELEARLRLMRLVGRSVPRYHRELGEPVEGDLAAATRFYLERYALGGGCGFLRWIVHVATCLVPRKGKNADMADRRVSRQRR